MTQSYEYNKSWRGDSRRAALNLKTGEVIAIELEVGDDEPNQGQARLDEDTANELAELFIESLGFDMSDSDQRGDEMGATVRDTLTFLFLRIGVRTVAQEAERSVWGSQA